MNILKKHYIPLLLALSALYALLPALLYPSGADFLFHWVAIDCFSQQFWQGDLYPRWCFSANAYMGAPLFLFYFPLPYYISAAFYPLTKLGATIDHVYTLSLLAANLVTAVTAYIWLRPLTTPAKALFGVVVYLLFPYRMEVAFSRVAYAELWCMAFLPLMLHGAHKLVLRHSDAPYIFAIGALLALLSHVPATLIAIIACGLYVFLATGKNIAPKARFAWAVILAFAASTFYWLPAALYQPYINPHPSLKQTANWANNFMGEYNLIHQSRIMVNFGISLAGSTILLILCNIRALKMPDATLKRDIRIWSLIFIIAVFSLFPISKPLWDLASGFTNVLFPWRSQLAIMTATLSLLIIHITWQQTAKQQKTQTMDAVILVAFMSLLSFFVLSNRNEDYQPLFDDVVKMHYIVAPEYKPIWTDAKLISYEAVVDRTRLHESHPRLLFRQGNASAVIEQWDFNGITLSVNAQTSSTLVLNHNYFPVWNALLENGTFLYVSPEPESGRIMISVPAGQHRVMLYTSIERPSAFKMKIAYLFSIIALIIIALMYRRRKTQ